MRRLTAVLFVALLALNVAGLPSLFLPEPCGIREAGPEQDGACPPTCVLCGCCAQSAIPASHDVDLVADLPTSPVPLLIHAPLSVAPGEILHVPKSPTV